MFAKTSLLLACAFASAADEWEAWKLEHGKVYNSDEEDVYRRSIFESNMAKIPQLQEENPLAEFGPNHLSDLTEDELPVGWVPGLDDLPTVTFNDTVADSKDWTGVATTPVKDQGRCGSCWAFSAVEQIESMYKIQNDMDFTGAPQQLVDCKGDRSQRNGCNGGNPMEGYQVLQKLGGLEAEADYPYRAQNQRCSFSADKVKVKVSNARKISGGESGMKSYVGGQGPLSICHDTGGWQSYKRGILSSCSRGGGHCTQVVGYGDESGASYWKVRNSWGTGFGESGFIRLAYGRNLCGLTQLANTVDAAPAGPSDSSSVLV